MKERDAEPGARQPYEKPAIRPIELAVEEAVMGACKVWGGQEDPCGPFPQISTDGS